MQAIRSILVVINPEHPHDAVMRRARLIAGNTGAEMHLLVCDEKTSHEALLAYLAEELRSQGHEVRTRQQWQEPEYKAFIAAQQAEGCGLVVKQHTPDNPLKKTILTPDDWKLLRHCPCPVLMVKTEQSWLHGNVMAAVDVGSDDPEHVALHNSIVAFGFDLAKLVGGQLHILSAHPTPMMAAADPTLHLRDVVESRYREACKAFQLEYGVADTQFHVEHGPADVLIPETAKKINAVVTVLGTVARTGVPGVLMGNTAEVVLDELQSDVLVLKPEDIAAHLEEMAAQL